MVVARCAQESMFDETLKKLTLSVRFPVEYPLSPPEVSPGRPGTCPGQRRIDDLSNLVQFI